jgi:hypothetical protein
MRPNIVATIRSNLRRITAASMASLKAAGRHVISIDIHVSILHPPPTLKSLHAFKWEATDGLESAFTSVDVSIPTLYQARML